MGRKNAKEKKEMQGPPKPTVGQPMLMDVGPKNAKEIVKKAKEYRAVLSQRMALVEEECALKKELLRLVSAEHLKRLADGSIQFHVDGIKITVTPRDELIKVREDGVEEEG